MEHLTESAPQTLEGHDAQCREADVCMERANRAWCAARWAAHEHRELCEEFAYALKCGDMCDELCDLAEQIDNLERRHPLLATGIPAQPPHPCAAPFVS